LPEVAWRTPIPELLIAMDAKIEWSLAFHPFGGGKKKEPERQTPQEMRKALRAK
jgi:hypothetical protein